MQSAHVAKTHASHLAGGSTFALMLHAALFAAFLLLTCGRLFLAA